MSAAKQYYVLSLKYTKGDFITWWGPACKGYTRYLSSAGLYNEHEVKEHRLNDGEVTLAVPVADVERFVRRVVCTDDIREVCKQPLYQTSDGMQTQAVFDRENEKVKKQQEERERRIAAGEECPECSGKPGECAPYCSHYEENEDD